MKTHLTCRVCRERYPQYRGLCRRCWREAHGEVCIASPNPFGRGGDPGKRQMAKMTLKAG